LPRDTTVSALAREVASIVVHELRDGSGFKTNGTRSIRGKARAKESLKKERASENKEERRYLLVS